MGKFNKVLVAVDGSETSKNALRQTCKLAFDEKKWITVVAIDPPYQGDLDLIGVSNIKELLKGKGEEILEDARKIAENEKASIKTRHEEGEPFKKIIEIANEEKCELIVLGRRGITRFERALMGSVTAKVIGHFKGRTLVVPEDANLGWKNILVAYDGSKYSEAALSEAVNYAKSYGGGLNIVSAVYTNDEILANSPDVVDKMIQKAKDDLETAKEQAGREGVNAGVFVREGEAYEVINSLADELRSDMIVIGSRGKTALKQILMGSVTSRVIGLAHCPVMVINR